MAWQKWIKKKKKKDKGAEEEGNTQEEERLTNGANITEEWSVHWQHCHNELYCFVQIMYINKYKDIDNLVTVNSIAL